MACIAFKNTQQLPISITTDAIENILGISTETLLEQNSNIMDWIHPEDALGYMNELQDYIDQPEIEHFEKNDFRIVTQQQRVEWIREQGYLERNDKGSVLNILVCWHKVTEEYDLKQNQRESKQNLNVMLESLNVGFFEYFFGTDKVIYSESWKSILGYQSHEIENQFSEWEKRTPVNYVETTMQSLDKHLQGEAEWFEAVFPMRHKNGHQIWALAKGKSQNNAKGFPHKLVGTFTDLSSISEIPAKTEASSKKTTTEENTFEQIFMQAPVGMTLFDINGTIVDINPKLMDMLGYHPSEVRGRSISQFLHADDRQEAFQNFEKLFKSDIAVITATRRVFEKNGHIKYINFSSFIITTKKGEKLLCSTGVDNTAAPKEQQIQKNLDELILNSTQPK